MLAEEFKKRFTLENTKKCITLQKLIKMEKKFQKIYLTYYNLLIAQDLLQAHYQILSIKKCKTCQSKYKYCDCFLEYTKFKEEIYQRK